MNQFKLIIFFFLSLAYTTCDSQDYDTNLIDDSYLLVNPIEIMPKFPGNDSALWCFIDLNLDKEKLNKIDKVGLIAVHFIIDSTGVPKEFEILRSLDSAADNEFLRVLKLMPNWEPGSQNNRKVPVYFTIQLRLPYVNKFCR